MSDNWNTNIDDIVVRPIAKKAINLYAEELLQQDSIEIKKEIDGHEIRLIKNSIIAESFWMNFLAPYAKEAEYMINVEVKIKNSWFVGIYYKFKNNKWIEANELKKLTTYRG